MKSIVLKLPALDNFEPYKGDCESRCPLDNMFDGKCKCLIILERYGIKTCPIYNFGCIEVPYNERDNQQTQV